MKKRLAILVTLIVGLGFLAACSGGNKTDSSSTTAETSSSSSKSSSSSSEVESVKLTLAAAASLEYALEEKLIPMFQKEHPEVTIEGSYDSSGKLQTQIEEGMGADLFFSAATKQMDTLVEQQLIKDTNVSTVLENKVVLIVPADKKEGYSTFNDIEKVGTIALGDPESVPAGQYAEEALTSLGIWEGIQDKVSWGTNVTEVLNWVAEGSADAGIVYETDAKTTDKVAVIAPAPEDSLKKKVLYPLGILESSENKQAAQTFYAFLQSKEAAEVFTEYGFTPLSK